MKETRAVVISAKMQKTVVARINRLVQHPRYKKYINQRTKIMARDDLGCKPGDVVVVEQIRKLSKRVSWRVVKVVGSRVLLDGEQESLPAAPEAAS